MKQQRAVIIIPTYNEKENIAKLLPVLEDEFKKITHWDMHVLVVDDSSPDGTTEVARQFEKKNKHIHVHVNAKKAGLGAAYLSGMKEAFGPLEADVVFEFDADFSHDPKKIPEFLQKIDAGADFVVGSRYIKGGSIPDDWGTDRKFLSVIGNLFMMVIFTDFRIHDWTSGYRAIRKSVYTAVKDRMADPRLSGYTFQAAFLRSAVKKGFKIAEVPFMFIDRKIGKSKLGSENIKTTLQYVISDRFNEIVSSHIFKFGVVGGIGFIVTASGSFLFTRIPALVSFANQLSNTTHLAFISPTAIATAVATECAIVSNFILNNLFTFSDRKLKASQVIPKFVQFNVGSLGAVVINFLVVGIGTSLTGIGTISKLTWLVIATAIAMFVNYMVYSKLIWKKK